MKVSEIINTLAVKGFSDIELIQGQIMAEINLDGGGMGLTIVPLDDWLQVVLWESWSGAAISDRHYLSLGKAISTLLTVASIEFARESERVSQISKR